MAGLTAVARGLTLILSDPIRGRKRRGDRPRQGNGDDLFFPLEGFGARPEKSSLQ